jgi:hypothetical protein
MRLHTHQSEVVANEIKQEIFFICCFFAFSPERDKKLIHQKLIGSRKIRHRNNASDIATSFVLLQSNYFKFEGVEYFHK